MDSTALIPLQYALDTFYFLICGALVMWMATWNDGTARSAADDGAGRITGSATGEIDYATAQVTLVPAALPLAAQVYDVSYTYGDPDTATFTDPVRESDGTVIIDLGETNLKPGSVALAWNLQITDYSFLSNTPAEMQYYVATGISVARA